jgi:hypothetical protein
LVSIFGDFEVKFINSARYAVKNSLFDAHVIVACAANVT